jgi:hypothetical protein
MAVPGQFKTPFDYTAEAMDRKIKARQQQLAASAQPAPPPAVAPTGPDLGGLDKVRQDQMASRATNDAAALARSQALEGQTAGQFNTLRQRAQQQGNVQKIQNNEALKRRFASIGNLNSGAAIKAQGIADQESDRSTNQAVQDVDMQEQQQKLARTDAENQRLFQRDMSREDSDSNQAFQGWATSNQLKLQWADLNESMKANKISAAGALSNLKDNLSWDELRSLTGEADSDKIYNALLKKYGYGG